MAAAAVPIARTLTDIVPERRRNLVRGWIRFDASMLRGMKLEGVWRIGRTYGNELLNEPYT